MSTYKMSSGLVTVIENPEFETDAEAWDYLRKKVPGRWVTLYRKTEIKVPVINAKESIPRYNRKYTLQTIHSDTHDVHYSWVPVLFGSSDDPYDLN